MCGCVPFHYRQGPKKTEALGAGAPLKLAAGICRFPSARNTDSKVMKRCSISIVVLAVMLLPGCVFSNPARQKGVSAGSDSFCISAKKRSWDLTDSAET